MIALAHISDIHLAPLPPVRPLDLMNKRITGYVNWRLKRKDQHGSGSLASLVDHLKATAPDFIAVAGDLVNLALDEEFANSARWLENLGPPQSVCVVPGNHDAYVPGALEKARLAWGGYMQGETLDAEPFPYVRRIGDVAVVGCSSAIATPPFIAAGRFDEPQAARLASQLKDLGEAGYFRVVMIHHPPFTEGVPLHKRMFGARLFREILGTHGADMVLHGHTHASTIHAIPGPDGEIPVIGVAAAGARPGPGSDPGRYNLFLIERMRNRWSCTMREWGYQRLGDEIVMRLQTRIC
ncbi:MAG TPA: metallophosphoesterase [Devosiaceae bacterium]